MTGLHLKWDNPILGILLGLLAPLLGVIVFYFVQSAEMHGLTIEVYLEMMGSKRIMSMILSWSLLANLAVFAMFNRIDFLRTAQGVVISTILYGILIVYLKIF